MTHRWGDIRAALLDSLGLTETARLFGCGGEVFVATRPRLRVADHIIFFGHLVDLDPVLVAGSGQTILNQLLLHEVLVRHDLAVTGLVDQGGSRCILVQLHVLNLLAQGQLIGVLPFVVSLGRLE